MVVCLVFVMAASLAGGTAAQMVDKMAGSTVVLMDVHWELTMVVRTGVHWVVVRADSTAARTVDQMDASLVDWWVVLMAEWMVL